MNYVLNLHDYQAILIYLLDSKQTKPMPATKQSSETLPTSDEIGLYKLFKQLILTLNWVMLHF